MENYKPLSILPALSKIFENDVIYQIQKNLDGNEIIPISQFGFKKGGNVVHTNLKILCMITDYRNQKKIVAVIILDVKKALTGCDNSVINNKLKNIGAGEKTLKWISLYLTNRRQSVVIGSFTSKERVVKSGVGQGYCMDYYFSKFIFMTYQVKQN